MKCRICGSDIAVGVKVCDFCGSPIKNDTAEAKQIIDENSIVKQNDNIINENQEKSNNYINNDNYISFENDAIFSEFSATETTPIQNNTSSQKNNSNVAIYVMIGTIVALICFIIVILLMPRGEKAIHNDTLEYYSYENTTDNSEDYDESEYKITFDQNSDYIYPSDTKYISKEQLHNLTKEEVALLRNEIYARHGYDFQSQQYKDYFKKKTWYTPSSYFDESMFNSIEKENKDLIVEYEIEMGWR